MGDAGIETKSKCVKGQLLSLRYVHVLTHSDRLQI